MGESGSHRVGGLGSIAGLEFYHADHTSSDYARSLHLSWEIGMCSAGEAELVTDTCRLPIAAGTLFLIPPHTAHTIEGVSQHSICAIRLRPELVEELLGYSPPIPLEPIVDHPEPSRQTWCWLCGQLLDALPEPAHRSALIGGLQTIFSQLDGSMVRPPIPDRVTAMQEMLVEKVAEKVSLEDLGDRVELSQFHAARLFKSTFGVSPHEYQILLRISAAKRLLLAGESATEVAASVGFSDQSHLHRYFKRYVHVTPGEYRRWRGSESKKIQAEIAARMGQFLRNESADELFDAPRGQLLTVAESADERS